MLQRVYLLSDTGSTCKSWSWHDRINECHWIWHVQTLNYRQDKNPERHLSVNLKLTKTIKCDTGTEHVTGMRLDQIKVHLEMTV